MKCILNKGTGAVERVSDDKAAYDVRTGVWAYVSKGMWKAYRKSMIFIPAAR